MTDSKTPDWAMAAADDVWTALANNEANGREAEMALFSQALLYAYERGRAEREWQDISTARNDGTEIIGYRPDQGVFVFRWAWMEEFVPKDQHGDPAEDYDDTFADWWHDRWDWMEGELRPTHWMHLPAPPAKENANER